MSDPWGEVMGQSRGRPDWDWSHIIAILGAIESGHTQSRLRAVSISNLKGGNLCQQTASDYSKKDSDKIPIVGFCLNTFVHLISDYLKMQMLTFNRNIFTIKVGVLYRNWHFIPRWLSESMEVRSTLSHKKSRAQSLLNGLNLEWTESSSAN